MSDTINLNSKDVAVTMIKEIGDIRHILQFKSYDDFMNYQERTGSIEPIEDPTNADV